LGFFDILIVWCPTSEHHIYNDNFASSISCRNRSQALFENLDAGVIIEGIQNSLRYIEGININVLWGKKPRLFKRKPE
jgi:hypothetical protein